MSATPPARNSGAAIAMPDLPWSTSLRALACLVVMIYHGILTVVDGDLSSVERLIVLVAAATGRLSVLSFILLSGYLLGRHWTHEFARENLGSRFRIWMARRSVRIIPTYLVTVVIVIAAMAFLGFDEARGTHWDTGLPFTWERSLATLTLTTDIFNQVPLSHQLWTVPLEYHLYLLAPLVVLLRSGVAVAVAGAAAVLAAGFLNPGFTAPWFPFAFMAAFWVGVRRREAAMRGTAPARSDLWLPMLLPVLGAVLVFLWADLDDSPHNYLPVEVVFTLVFLPLIRHLDVSGARGPLIRLVELRPIHTLGVWSYSIYLAHALVLEATWRYVIEPASLSHWQQITGVCALGIVLSVLAGWCLYLLVEGPSERKARTIRPRAAPIEKPKESRNG